MPRPAAPRGSTRGRRRPWSDNPLQIEIVAPSSEVREHLAHLQARVVLDVLLAQFEAQHRVTRHQPAARFRLRQSSPSSHSRRAKRRDLPLLDLRHR